MKRKIESLTKIPSERFDMAVRAHLSSAVFGPRVHIYGWTLGFDLSPADVPRKFGHPEVVELVVSHLSPMGRLIDALWMGDAARARAEIPRNANAIDNLHPLDKELLPAAAWWYRPESVRLMMEIGFHPMPTS